MGKYAARKVGWYWIQTYEDGTTDLYAGPFHSRSYAWTKGRVVAAMPKSAQIVFLKASEVSAPTIIDRRKEYVNAKK